MKKKIIIAVGIISAICVIGFGIWLKMQDGHTLSTDKEILAVMGKILKDEPDRIELLQKRIYKNQENQLMLVAVRSKGVNILQIFKENSYHKYEEYYNYMLDSQGALILLDPRHKAAYVICNNDFNQITGFEVINESEEVDVKPLTDTGRYIIECYDNVGESIHIFPVNDEGDYIDNFSYAQDTIR